jgi:putative transposase
MSYNPARHHRRSIRLRGYDYSRPGYYFITICIHDRTKRLFADIPVEAGSVIGAGSKPAPTTEPALYLTEYGKIVHYTWNDLPNHISGITLDEFIIMPNHIHGIIRITGAGLERAGLERAGLEPAPTVALPEIVRQFKTFSSKRINIARNSRGMPVWQRNYYDQIIRNDKSLYFIRNYIRKNPMNWNADYENHIEREIVEFDMIETGSEE